MRKYIAVLVAMILSGCGGGDDVTSPPAGQGVTLTVAGQGSGAGEIRTGAGVQPAINCSVNGDAEPTGICSAEYDTGTVVGLTVTPGENSSFTGWGEDGADCGTELSCSITMSDSKTVIAQLVATSTEVQVVSSAYYPEPDFGGEGAVIWVVEVRNAGSQTVESAQINFTSRDAGGGVLASDFTFVGPIPPGETRAGRSFAEYHGNEASVDLKVGEVIIATEAPNLGAATIVSSNWQADPNFEDQGAVVWSAQVQNTSNNTLQGVQVDFTTYDAEGKIVDYDATFVGPLEPGETLPVESFTELHGNEADARFQIGSVF